MKISWKITVSAEFRARDTAQKMKFSIEDFFSKCDEIRSFLRIWPHLLEKSLMENFTFCAVLNSVETVVYHKFQHQEVRQSQSIFYFFKGVHCKNYKILYVYLTCVSRI